MRSPRAFMIVFAAAGVFQTTSAAEPAPHVCDGLPRLAVQTAPGFCLGLVASGLRSPRGLQMLPTGEIIVADMGGWLPGRGRIWLLKAGAGRYEKTALFDKLDRPNAVAISPGGDVFVGMARRVVRLELKGVTPKMTDVIGGSSGVDPLPDEGRHLLPSLLFDARGDLFVNIGSASDHCEDKDGKMPTGDRCAEREGSAARAVIRKYAIGPGGKVRSWEVYAKGLRNSMALAFDQQGRLWQGENGRDAINAAMPALANDDDLPHDELNLIERGADYGWPYCYDDNRSSPEYARANCSGYRAPRRLLPAHAAPLGMLFYKGRAFPPRFNGSLIVTYHGYRHHGHRLVALLADAHGAPLGKQVDLVTGSRQKSHRFGAPVGVTLGVDGRLYLSDDHDGVVARLSYEGARP